MLGLLFGKNVYEMFILLILMLLVEIFLHVGVKLSQSIGTHICMRFTSICRDSKVSEACGHHLLTLTPQYKV